MMASPGDGLCADAANQCTLRAAIEEANAAPSGSSITVTVPVATYPISLGPLNLIDNAITVQGAGAGRTVIASTRRDMVLSLQAGAQATLIGVAIARGYTAPASGFAGGIYNTQAGVLSLIGSLVTRNAAASTTTRTLTRPWSR